MKRNPKDSITVLRAVDNEYITVRYKGQDLGEHNYVMQEYLGRIIGGRELVHHINGIKKDNRIKNLIVLTQWTHGRLHARMRKAKRIYNRKDIEKFLIEDKLNKNKSIQELRYEKDPTY